MIAGILLLFGSLLVLLAAVGVLRLPDTFARLQAASKAASLGLVFVFFGGIAADPGVTAVVKLLLAIVFQFATAPVAAQVIANAAYHAGIPMWHGTVDELKGKPSGGPGPTHPLSSSTDPV